WDRVPSLGRNYSASSVLRTHPSSTSAAANPHEFDVDVECRSHHEGRLLLLRVVPIRACCHHYPGGNRRLRFSFASPTTSAFLVIMASRLPHWLFRGLLDVHSRYGPHGL